MNFEFFKPQNWQKNPLKRAGVIVRWCLYLMLFCIIVEKCQTVY